MADDAPETPLPVRAVTLFSSGVAYTLREGQVESGERTVSLSFRTSQVSDILKSLVVLDETGEAQAATFPSRDPLGRTLQSFAVDVTNNLSRADLLRQVRGAAVRVETTESETLEGRVVGIETREEVVDRRQIFTETLTLLGEEGLTAIALDRVRTLRLLDERLDRELREALVTLAAGSDDARRVVTLRFTGASPRPVRVGYITETPLWKMSYRLVLDEMEDEANVAAKPYLQGWALVENTTDEDWSEVRLSLISGRPISFIQDLYQPLYVPRPVVGPDIIASPYPQAHAGTMEDDLSDAFAAAMPPPAPPSAMPLGAAAGGGARMKRAQMVSQDSPFGSFLEEGVASPAKAEAAAMRHAAPAQAQGQGVGELFEYHIAAPVTLPRQQAAMLPVVSEDVEGERLSLYNPNGSSSARHPLNAFRLRNNTALHLKGGPVTVFDGGVYAGDARLEDVPPGDSRLVTYAVDLAVEGERQTGRIRTASFTLVLRRGVLTVTRRNRQSTTYVLRNKAKRPRLIYVEHPFASDWALIAPEAAAERTPDWYRFAVTVAPGTTERLIVETEQPVDHQVTLIEGDLNALHFYTTDAVGASAPLRAALTRVLERRRGIQEREAQADEREASIAQFHTEQDRMRKNMGALEKNTPLYRRYVKELDQQETQMQALYEEAKALRAQAQAARDELRAYLDNLEIDAT